MNSASSNCGAKFLDKADLAKLKTKALRAGVWFKALARIDRVLVDLTIRVADAIRSPNLARCVLEVAGKLESALENRVTRFIREFGFAIAYKLSLYAVKWGNRAAVRWARDPGFARYWAVMKLNGHPCSG
jgi:hypothetical protein